MRLKHFTEVDGYSQGIASYAIQDEYGYVWVGKWNGLSRYDGYRFENFRMRPGDNSPLKSNRIATIRELENHDLECALLDSAFYVFHTKTGQFEAIDKDYKQRPLPFKADSAVIRKVKSIELFHDTYIRILLVDRQGGIWVDTHSGLYRIWYARRPLQPTKMGKQADEEVRGLFVDKQQRTWIADKNGYVRLFSKEQQLLGYLTSQGQISKIPTAFGQWVYCFFEDSQGNLWLGCKPSGLVRLDPQGNLSFNIRRYTFDSQNPWSISSNNIYAIAEDNCQRLWIAAYRGGLNMLDLKADDDRFYNCCNALKTWPSDSETARIRCLYITPEQVLVAGTMRGLYTCRLDQDISKLHFYNNRRSVDDATSLSYDWVSDIQPLNNDTLAIATSGGGISMADSHHLLSDDIRFKNYITDQGLASDDCLCLLYDGRNSLYAVSQTAISRLSLKDGRFTNYLRGTLGEDFNFLETKPYITASGRYLFGTTRGVLDVRPQDLQKSSCQPKIIFDQLEMPFETEGNQLAINLPSEERNLTLRFAAIDYNKNVPITYAYRIDGMNDEWVYITDNTITLSNIKAGNYCLHLRSTNGDGIWTDNEQTLTITRHPSFHETPYAWILYGVLLTLLTVGVIMVVRYIRQLQEEIKDIRLTANERREVLGERIREQLSIPETVEKVEPQQEDIQDEDDRRFAEHIKAYVNEHLMDSEISVPQMAREMGVSRTILFARMKSVFGTSPNNYVINQRILHAQQLLAEPGVYVTDVAYKCGFSSQKYFSQCFKKITGQTPTEYQQRTT